MLEAVRQGDEHAVRAAAKDLIQNAFAQARKLLVGAVTQRGVELHEPLAVTLLGEDGKPFDMALHDSLFLILVDASGQRMCVRIEFDAPRKVQ